MLWVGDHLGLPLVHFTSVLDDCFCSCRHLEESRVILETPGHLQRQVEVCFTQYCVVSYPRIEPCLQCWN
jgi:hypothetical protein